MAPEKGGTRQAVHMEIQAAGMCRAACMSGVPSELIVIAGIRRIDDLLAAIVTVGADVVPTMRFASGGFGRDGRRFQPVMRLTELRDSAELPLQIS